MTRSADPAQPAGGPRIPAADPPAPVAGAGAAAAPPYIDGVCGQPERLRRSAASLRAALAGVGADPLIPGRVAVLGMGASAAAATGFAVALREVGRPAVTLSPAELGEAVPAGLADAYFAISQSGRSRETVAALNWSTGGRRIALTNDPRSPLAVAADAVLPLGCGVDTRVSTLSYTATVQALALLVDTIADRPSAWLPVLPDAAAAVLATDAGPVAEAFADVSGVDVVGGGVQAASASAAALLLREAAHLPAAGYPTREYLHGHLEVAGRGRGALLFGTGRELPLAAELASYGCAVVLVTRAPGGLPAHRNLRVVRLPALPGLAGCVLDILPVQLAAYRLAESKGLPIDLRHMPPDTKL